MSDIKLHYKNQVLVIDQLGGGIKQYYLEFEGKKKEIIHGYENDTQKVGSMGDVLFPFPGRVENSEYEFNGNKYKLSGLRLKDGHALHGFAKYALWEIISKTDSFVSLSFKMTREEYKGKGFPFSLSLNLVYSLSEKGLTCKAEVVNSGKESAPFGLGFHPYYSLGVSKVDYLSLQITAGKLVEFSPSLKPTGKLLDFKDGELDFSSRKAIGNIIIDNCFSNLSFNDSGINETILSSDDLRIKIWQDQNLPYLQLYSADTIGEENYRIGLAIEPQTCTGFALNMPDMGLMILQPKENFNTSWGVFVY